MPSAFRNVTRIRDQDDFSEVSLTDGSFLKYDESTDSFVLESVSVPVTSVFGRTGSVIASVGDYNADQVTNALSSTGSYSNPSWLTALSGGKITGDISGNAASINGSITESQVMGLISDLNTLAANIVLKAPIASPALTGTPTAPTATVGTNTTQLATTEFVLGQGFVTSSSSPVTSVAGLTGAITGANLKTALSLNNVENTALSTWIGSINITTLGTVSTGSIPYSLLTGTPTIPTWDNPTATVSGMAVNGSATTFMRSDAAPALANTAVTAGSYTYSSITVDAQGRLTTASSGTTPVTSVFGRTGVVLAVSGDYSVGQITGAAPLASPTFTGTPAAPTASTGTNTTQLATTAFVLGQGFVTSATAPVTSVSNSDGTLTISPTTGAVVASLALSHANAWTGQQTFGTSAPVFSTMTAGSVLFAGTAGLLSQDNSSFFYDSTNHRLGIGTASPAATLDIVKNVAGGSDNYVLVLQNKTSATDARIGIRFQESAAATKYGAALYATNDGVTGKGHLVFGTYANDVFAEAIRITSAGNLQFANSNYLITGRNTAYLAFQPVLAGIAQIEYYTYTGNGTEDNGFAVFAKGLPTSVTNFEQTRFYYSSSATAYIFGSNKGGTGSDRDLRIGNGLVPTDLFIKATTGLVGVNSVSPGAQLQINASTSSTIGQIVRGAASRSAALLQLQTSAGESLGNIGGVIFNNFTDTSTTHTDGTEDDLYSYTTAANTLAINGDSIEQVEHIQFVASATAARRVKKYFAGTLIFDSGALTLTLGGDFTVWTTLIRESSTVVRVDVSVTTTSASTVPYSTYTRITDLTLTGTNILKTTGIASGTGAASGDVIAKISKVWCWPAA